MRAICVLLAGAALTASAPGLAADQLKFGAPAAWVVPQTIPSASDKVKDKPVALLLHDQQTLLEPGKISTYTELAFKIQKPEGLAAGNLSVSWNPATDSVTVNRLEIRRGSQVIDVLKSGQTFTTMRRESNLELATLDGVLTANIQPEGLQEGDVVVLADTVEHADPVLKGHVETAFAPWSDAQIGLAHARLIWPSYLNVKVHSTGDLAAPQQSSRDGRNIYEITMRDVEPVIAPKGAPVRFKIGRLGDATDFHSWADVANLMTPLFRDAAVIPAAGPLRDEVEKIRKASADPKLRTEQALQLVQQRIRYVALLMGQGGLVPAKAEETWARRFGDCKAKTTLLLGILHELGIKAEAVAVNPFIGDAIAERQPMVAWFDHVLVRAHVGGKDFWLDGTRDGDTTLDRLQVPKFGWGLPLVENTQLVHIVPPPLEVPSSDTQIEIDARSGVFAPAKVRIEEVLRGDVAVEYNNGYAQLSTDQRTQYLHENAKTYFDSISGDSGTFTFDQAKGELRILITGSAKLDWKDGWYSVPSVSLGYTPDFDRPAGPQHDAPIATGYPSFEKHSITMDLPPGFGAGQKKFPAPVKERLAGVDYERTISLSGDVLKIESSERSDVPEIAYKDALADEPRLKALDKDDVYLQMPGNYRASKDDLAAIGTETPGSADEYARRGDTYLDALKFDQAIADFTKALELEPKNANALADRGITYVWKGDFPSAEKDLVAAEALDPNKAVIFRARGLMAQKKGDLTAATDAYTRSLTIEPQNSFALGHRAEVYAALNENDKAMADAGQALKTVPSWIDLRLMRANILMRTNRDLVAAEAEAMMRDNPSSNFAFVAAGKTYAALGQREKAMQALDRALAIKPEAYIYINRSEVRAKSDVAGRTADIDAAVKLEPDNPDVLAEKARFLTDTGDYKGALAIVARIKPTPGDAYAEQQRAIVMYKAGQTDQARKLFEAVEIKTQTATEFNNLCWTKAINGLLLESALQDCRQALKLRPDTGQYEDSLGMVLLKLGKLEEALDAYNKAVAKNTGADSLMGRALVYLRKGDRGHAEADAAAARKLSATIDDVFAEYGLSFDDKAK